MKTIWHAIRQALRCVLLAAAAMAVDAADDSAGAQFGGGRRCPTYISINAIPQPHYQTSAAIAVNYGQDSYVYPDGQFCQAGFVDPDPETFQLWVNGSDQTINFSAEQLEAAGTVTGMLNRQNNVIVASITGWDTSGTAVTNVDTLIIYVDLTPKPVVDLEPHNADNQIAGLCAAGCFAAQYAHTTVPYITLDQPRAVTLVHRSDRTAPRPFIHVDARVPAGASAPSEFWLEGEVKSGASWTDISFLHGDVRKIRFTGDDQVVRLSGQLDAVAAGLTTGVYPLRLTVTAKYASGVVESAKADTTTLIIVDEASSPIARGWTVAGLQRLRFQSDTGVLVIDGDGSAAWFKKVCSPGCTWTSPRGDFSRLTVTGSGTSAEWVRAFPDSSKVKFDYLGRMTRSENRFGIGSDLAYDGSGRLSTIADPIATQTSGGSTVPAKISLVYGTHGLSEIREPAIGAADASVRRTTYVRVESGGVLRAIVDPDGDSTRFGYDGSNRLSTVVNRRGDTSTFAYHSGTWTVSSIELPAIPLDAGGGSTSMSSPAPTIAMTAWQRAAIPSGSTGTTPATVVRRDSVRAVVTDALGQISRYTADRWGQPIRSVGPKGSVTRIARVTGAKIFPDSIHDYLGRVHVFSWNGPYMTGKRPAGAGPTYYYYGSHSVVNLIKVAGRPNFHLFLGERGRVDSTRMGSDASTTSRFTYDALHRLTIAKDPLGHETRYHYDDRFGNTDSIVSPGNRFLRSQFDRMGRDSALQLNGQAPVRSVYDDMNRLVSLYDGVNVNPTRYGYDAAFLMRVEDPKGQVYRFERNAYGWLTRQFDAADTLSRYTSYRYDRGGRVTSSTNRRGERVDFKFDSLGRLLSKTGTNVTADSFSYSADGRTRTAWNAISRDSIFAAADGWLDSIVTRIGGRRFRIRYKPDTAMRLDSTLIGNDAGITFVKRDFGYNGTTGMLDTIRLDAERAFVYRNSELRPTGIVWPNGGMQRTSTLTSIHRPSLEQLTDTSVAQVLKAARRYGYDSLGRTAEMSTWLAGSNYAGRQYDYDGLGRLTAVDTATFSTCSAPNADYGYDCVPASAVSAETFSYDAVGNRAEPVDTLYQPGNRLIRFRGDSMVYDLDGNLVRKYNLTSGRDIRYYWTADGRLDSVHVGSVGIKYEYNALGQLARKRRNGTTVRHYLWDGSNLLVELNGTATQRISEYVHGPGVDRPLALVTGATAVDSIKYYSQNEELNLTELFDGAVIHQQISYDAWGTPSFVGASVNSLAWKGLLWEADSTKLYQVRNRWYDPQLGRFVSEDPLGLAGGMNAYVFADNDPINGWDPFGLIPCRWWENAAYCGEYRVGTAWSRPGIHNTGSSGGGGGGPGSSPGGGAGGSNNRRARLSRNGPDAERAFGFSFVIREIEAYLNSPVGQKDLACAAALGSLAINAAADVGTLGAGRAALSAVRAAEKHTGLANMVVQGSIRWHAHQGVASGSRTLALGAAAAEGTGLQDDVIFNAAQGPLNSWSDLGDFVPLVATGLAFLDAIEACR